MTVVRLKAETVLAVQLITRHRTVRLVAFLAAVVVAATWMSPRDTAREAFRTVFVVSGAVASVAASRVLSPGAALASVGRAAGAWWHAPVGRLLGVGLVATATASVAVVTLTGTDDHSTMLLFVSSAQAIGLGGIVMFLAPAWGASASGAIGLLIALLGPLPPSTVEAMLGDGSVFERIGVMLWNALPLAWRGLRVLEHGTIVDLAVFALWVFVSIVSAAWIVVPARFWADGPRRPS